MEIDVTQVIKNLDGTPAPRQFLCSRCGAQEGDNVLVLRDTLTNALTFRARNAPPLEATEQHARWKLAVRIQSNDEVVLNVSECAMLQELVALVYGPLVTGQVYELLEGSDDDHGVQE